MSTTSLPPTKTGLASGIQSKLLQFRRAVRISKIVELLLVCGLGLLTLYLVVMALDRLIDTNLVVRVVLLTLVIALIATYGPWMVHRWVWNTRRLTQVARLLSTAFPRLSDQVLSVVELASAKDEQLRSPQLVAAAMAQVERRLETVDLVKGVPGSRWRRFAVTVLVFIGITIALAIFVPQVSWNAFQRSFTPWRNVERFTFTLLEPLPESIIVPYGEPYDVLVSLKPESDWQPDIGKIELGSVVVATSRKENQYGFNLPGLLEATDAKVKIGDANFSTRIVPLARPELVELTANVELPEYLQYPEPLQVDARSGSIYALSASKLQIEGVANRPLSLITMNTLTLDVDAEGFSSPWFAVEHAQSGAAQEIELDWQDENSLRTSAPKTIRIRVSNDKLPAIACTGLSQQSVWLASDTLKFDVSADDDFGLKCVGLQWQFTSSENTATEPQFGQRVIISGAPQTKRLQGQATFNCIGEKITPQVLELRAFAEDYRGQSGRAYSVPYRIQFMSAAEHAEWVGQQLRRWKSKLDSVYDEELRLLDENQELRESMNGSSTDTSTIDGLKRQAAGELSNADKLKAADDEGKELLQQALRNEEIRSQQIDQWSRTLQRLNQLAGKDMPGVAEQLQSAAEASERASQTSSAPELAAPKAPELSRPESTMEKPNAKQQSENKSAGGGGASLPESRLGPGQNGDQASQQDSQSNDDAVNKVDSAVRDQTKVVEEFRKAREAFGDLLSELENSTFIKRLKAASDVEKQLASKLNSMISHSFGRKATELDDSDVQEVVALTQPLQKIAENVERIQRDLEGYQREFPEPSRDEVIKDMQDLSTITKLQEMPLRLSRNLRGDALHRTEYWADTFDRWAEELAGPGRPAGGGGDSETKDKLPPALLLDILRIIYDEMDLREETRTLGQVKVDNDATREERLERLTAQAIQQMYIQERTLNTISDIRALPNGTQNFEDELQKLGKAVQHMDDASAMLTDGNASDEVIAAETAAIEALIAAKRAGGGNGSGDSGGGSNAGGTTNRSALDLVGPGADRAAKVAPRQVGEGTGKTGRQLPEEYREGLDAFLNKIDQLRGNP